jgi:hypothetical protein
VRSFCLELCKSKFSTIKRQNQKGVHFMPGEHASIFKAVAESSKGGTRDRWHSARNSG